MFETLDIQNTKETLNRIRKASRLAPAMIAGLLLSSDFSRANDSGSNAVTKDFFEMVLDEASKDIVETLARPDRQMLDIFQNDLLRTRASILDALAPAGQEKVEHRVKMNMSSRVTGFTSTPFVEFSLPGDRKFRTQEETIFSPANLAGAEFLGRNDEEAQKVEETNQIEKIEHELREAEDFCISVSQLQYSLESNGEKVLVNGKSSEPVTASSTYIVKPFKGYSKSVHSTGLKIELSGEGSDLVVAYRNAMQSYSKEIGIDISEQLTRILDTETPQASLALMLDSIGIPFDSNPGEEWRALYDGIESQSPSITMSLDAKQSFLCVTNWSAQVTENQGTWKVRISGMQGELE
jgi:hypothetical protein